MERYEERKSSGHDNVADIFLTNLIIIYFRNRFNGKLVLIFGMRMYVGYIHTNWCMYRSVTKDQDYTRNVWIMLHLLLIKLRYV